MSQSGYFSKAIVTKYENLNIIQILLTNISHLRTFSNKDLTKQENVLSLCRTIFPNFLETEKWKNDTLSIVLQIYQCLFENKLKLKYSFESINNITDSSDINSLLCNYLLLFVLFVEKTLSPIEKLLQIEIKYQRKIYTVISEYIDIQASPSCRPIIVLFTLYNRVLELEKKVNELSNKEETFIQTISQLENELKEKTKELDEAIQKEMDAKKRNNEDIISDIDITYMKMKKSLNDQDYCKIILKKDYTISQLKKLLNNKEQRDNSNLTMSSIINEKQILFKDIITKYESQIKKLQNELDNLKSNTKIEFELMTSAMYNLGLNYLNYRNDTVNQGEGIPSWVIKEKKFLMENYFQNYLKD